MLHVWVVLLLEKFYPLYSYPACEYRDHSDDFQNKSVSFTFNWVYRHVFFLSKLKKRGRPFLRVPEGGWGTHREISPKSTCLSKEKKKVCSFVKSEIILLLLCCLLDPLTNKHWWAWIPMINLCIDSRTC